MGEEEKGEEEKEGEKERDYNLNVYNVWMMSKQEYEVTTQFTPVGNESSLIHTYLVQESAISYHVYG
ncbi:hypothetical protein M8J77_023686 [Diaphorina citri]|nr:hypothetical protein M8J77_023686 [Diaphorina citri]